MMESESDIKITTDISYLTLTGELWGDCCEDFGENWPHYNSTTVYLVEYWSCYNSFILYFAILPATLFALRPEMCHMQVV